MALRKRKAPRTELTSVWLALGITLLAGAVFALAAAIDTGLIF